jgi:hypothetical protein
MRRNNAPESLQVGNGVVEYLETDSGADVIRFAGPYNSALAIPVTEPVDCMDVNRYLARKAVRPQLE